MWWDLFGVSTTCPYGGEHDFVTKSGPLTKDEFIDTYMFASKIDKSCRTTDGCQVGEHVLTAVSCDCDYEMCQGWKMVSDSEMKIVALANLAMNKAKENIQ